MPSSSRGNGRALRDSGRKSLVVAAFLAALLAAGGVHAAGDGSFQAPRRAFSGNGQQMASGDFDRDGRPDLAVLLIDAVQVFLQDPRDPERWSPSDLFPAGGSNLCFRAGDLDGDGDPDLVVGGANGSLDALLCQGDGRFAAPLPLSPSLYVRALTLGDWDGDGALDLATANFVELRISIFLGHGDGRFTHRKDLPFFSEPHSIATLEADGEEGPDLAVGTPRGVFLLRGQGNGDFTFIRTSLSCRESMVAGDFNGDGLTDLATDCEVGLNQGGGVFLRIESGTRNSGAVAVGDWNGDGRADLARHAPPEPFLQISLGGPDGPGTPRPLRLSLGGVPFILGDDLDGDGIDEVVVQDDSPGSFHLVPGSWGLSFPGLRYLDGHGVARGFNAADLDGDGWLDLLILTSTGKVDVFPGAGRASLEEPAWSLAPAARCYTLEAADLDGDGQVDLLGVNVVDNRLILLFLDRGGTLREEVSLEAAGAPVQVRAAPLDGQEGLELLVVSPVLDRLTVFPGLGQGRFDTPRHVPTLARPRAVAVADLDSDGLLDLVVRSDQGLAVHRAEGQAAFSGPRAIPLAPGQALADLAVGDFDGDGLADLAVARRGSSDLLVYHGVPGLAFPEAATVALPAPPASLAAGDLDGDGRTDLTALSASQFTLMALRGMGDGGFSQVSSYGAGASQVGHLLADFDRDGTLDAATCGLWSSMVILGSPAQPAGFLRGDVDGDRRLGINDAILILSHLFLGAEAPPCPDAADADDSGELSLPDPIRILSRLFLGGGELPAPRACGPDPTGDALGPCRGSC